MDGFRASLRHAFAGLLHALGQRNMKLHVLAATMVFAVGCGIPLGLAEKVTLLFCVLLVFFAEILNTALEALVDLHTEDIRELARITKDTSAAGVLVLSVGAVLMFATILVYNRTTLLSHGAAIARQAALGLPLTAVVARLLFVRVARGQVAALVGLGLGLLAVGLPSAESQVFWVLELTMLGLAGRFALEPDASAASGPSALEP